MRKNCRKKVAHCIVCERQAEQAQIFININSENKECESGIFKCTKCDLVYVSPKPSKNEITNYYNGMYSQQADGIDYNKFKWAKRSAHEYSRNIYDRLPEHRQNTIKLLDVGGGLGYYTKAFEDLGYQVTLLEQDPISANFAKNILKIKQVVKSDAIEYLNSHKDNYDVIFARHVIEHFLNPKELTDALFRATKPGGCLILETDNNCSKELLLMSGSATYYFQRYSNLYKEISLWRLITTSPFAIDPPRHLYSFNKKNIIQLLRNSKYSISKAFSYRVGHPIYWPNFESTSMSRLLDSILHKNFRRFIATLYDIFMLPFRLLLELVDRGAGLVVYAYKKKH